jgi:hypothetical protein
VSSIEIKRPPRGGPRSNTSGADFYFFSAGVVAIVEVVVVDVIAVEVDSVPVPVVAVVVVAVSLTTAGASAAGAGAGASSFLHPVANVVTRTAASPRITNFFMSLISFSF